MDFDVMKGRVILQHDRLDQFMNLTGSAARSIIRIKHKKMSKYGLGSTHTTCLRRLFMAENGLTRTQLAQQCDLDKAQITRIVGELCKKGCIVEESKGSGYRKRIFLTDLGREITKDIYKVALEVNEYVSGSILQEDIDHFYKVFEKICSGLKQVERILDAEESATDQLEKGEEYGKQSE